MTIIVTIFVFNYNIYYMSIIYIFDKINIIAKVVFNDNNLYLNLVDLANSVDNFGNNNWHSL